MTKDALLAIYQAYLGLYATVDLTEQETEYFKSIIPDLSNIYVLGGRQDLLKLGKFLLLFKGRQHYKSILAYDIIFNYFGEGANTEVKDQATMEWFDTSIPVYMVNYITSTPKNKILESSISYLIQSRLLNSKTTIILTEVDLPEVKLNFPDKQQIKLQLPKIAKELNTPKTTVSHRDLKAPRVQVYESDLTKPIVIDSLPPVTIDEPMFLRKEKKTRGRRYD